MTTSSVALTRQPQQIRTDGIETWEDIFLHLLETDLPEAIDFRRKMLRDRACLIRGECDTAKVTGALAIAASPFLATFAGPLALMALVGGAIGYIGGVVVDKKITNGFYPIPFVRRSLMEVAAGAGGAIAEGESGLSATTAEEVTKYLENEFADEYAALFYADEEIIQLLSQLPADRRWNGYAFITNYSRKTGGELPTVEQILGATRHPVEPPPVAVRVERVYSAASITGDVGDLGRSLPYTPPPSVLPGYRTEVFLPSAPAPSSAPSLAAYANVEERMMVLLRAMAEAGFPLGTLLNHPFVWSWGRSQSGKTTIALLLAIARMAVGGQVSYFTTDNDYPRELGWGDVEDTPEGYATALESVRETISSADKGTLKGQSWLFDEMLAASAEHGLKIQPLLVCVLMKGAKTKGGVIDISQADTSGAHGLKGIDTAWRDERVSIEAIHAEDELGDRHPTGQYRVSKGDGVELWQIPSWMLTDKNQWGQPDPVVWMLKQFPELVQGGRSQAATASAKPSLAPSLDKYQAALAAVPGAYEFFQWLTVHRQRLTDTQGWMAIEELRSGWGQIPDALHFQIFLNELQQKLRIGCFSTDGSRWALSSPATTQEVTSQKKPLSPQAQQILDKYREKQRWGEPINASWVKQMIYGLKEYNPDQIRDFLRELAAADYGVVEGEGNLLAWTMRT